MTLVSAITVGILYAVGTYLLLQRTLTRIILGLALMGHGANVLLVTASGPRGAPPLVGEAPPGAEPFADPLPQALALTAIVITFGVIAFLLALSFRSWQLSGDDQVEDDVEDRRVARDEARLRFGVDAGAEAERPDTERPDTERPGDASLLPRGRR